MPFEKTKCPQCGKTFVSKREFEVANQTVYFGECGHIVRKDQIQKRDASIIVSEKGDKLRPFQVETVTHMEQSGGRDLIAHEMGLGKTVCALAFLALHHDEALPFLAVVKSTLKIQWQHMTTIWMGEDRMAQIIDTSKTPFLNGMTGYIISYDLLRRYKNLKAEIERLKIKTLILDECQQIKNHASQRTIFVRELTKIVPNIFALSGTPIKNNAGEYFPILNIIAPQVFSNLSNFQNFWCNSYWTGYGYKIGGLRDPVLFADKTKTFIIRKTREEVAPELPKVDRQFSFHELSEEVESLYKEEVRKFQHELSQMGSSNWWEDDIDDDKLSMQDQANILAYLSRMRHLAGLSLIDPCIDHVMEFLGSSERKLAIFVHHKDVAHILKMKLDKLLTELNINSSLNLTSDMSPELRAKTVEDFKLSSNRILIASTLASGEGLNLQFCSDCIMLERQWNPANEEQAEARFVRIGQTATSVTATYFIAVGTVVEFFTEIVERKRQYVSSTLEGKEAPSWDQSSIIRELADKIASCGLEKWGWK